MKERRRFINWKSNFLTAKETKEMFDFIDMLLNLFNILPSKDDSKFMQIFKISLILILIIFISLLIFYLFKGK